MTLHICSECSNNASLQYEGTYYCLLHYSTSEASLNFNIRPPMLLNDEILRNEEGTMRSLWKNAISDVLFRMYQLQKVEEDRVREDPLALFTINIPPLPPPSTVKSTNERKHQPHTVTMNSRHHDTLNPYSRKTKREKPLLRGDKRRKVGGPETEASNNDEPGKKVSTSSSVGDVQCEHCFSFNTKTRHLSGQCDSSRSETWGSKLGPSEIAFVDCLDCYRSFPKCE